MKKLFLLLVGCVLSISMTAETVENPLWLRNSAISPDGSTIAFTYQGNIYTVASSGGKANRLTSTAFNSYPIWSPDGKQIAFASDREGSLDIYIVDAEGGTPTRLTTHSGSEVPRAFLDNENIIFQSHRNPSPESVNGNFLGVTEVVSTVAGSRPKLFMSVPAPALSVKGNKVLYQDKKGYEDGFRKHERSSGTSDIWLLTLGDDGKAANGTFVKLTDFNGHDLNPVWKDSKSFYYISEEDGTLNVYQASADGSSKKQLTKFDTHPVRHLSATADGKKLAFNRDGHLYTLVPGEEPKKVNVTIVSDLYQPEAVKSILRGRATSVAVSPDGKEIAFVAHGNVYVTSKDYKTTKQITSTPEQERIVDFSPDGKTLVYDSERDGLWQLFTAKVANPDEESFTYATEIIEEPLYKSDAPAFQPSFSPDGKKVAFLEGRTELKVLDIASGKVNTALPGKFNYSYSDGDIEYDWSPDSKWFLTSYIGEGGWNNMDIALVAADGSQVTDLTNSGYSDTNFRWAMKGKAMIWETDKQGYRSHGSWGAEGDIYIMFFDGDAYDRFLMSKEDVEIHDKQEEKKKEAHDNSKKKGKKDKDGDDKEKEEIQPLVFDLDNAPYRVRRLTSSSSNLSSFYLDDKGENLYYGSDRDLWRKKIREKDTEVIAKGGGNVMMIPSDDGEKLFLVDYAGSISVMDIPGSDSKQVEFEAPLEHQTAAERQYIYDHVWRQVKEKFYDENLHSVDWEKYKTEYEKFLPHITNNYDFADMLSELLGELNASHTGARYYAPGASNETAELGAFFDEDWDGDGLKISEVIKMGPLASKEVNAQPGELIMAINGEPIRAGKDYYKMLEGKGGEKIRLTLKGNDGEERNVYIKPTESVRQQLYRRWVEHNRHVVDSVSGGKVGYVHIAGMDSPSFRTAYEEMLGRHRNCDAIIVDTRYNSGGWLHNDIAVLMAGKEYVRFMPRGRYIGSEPFSQWHKPSVMLVNQANYSDGHGAPYAYQVLGLGDVIGAPIPGTMTAVWWENQIDPTIVFGIPQVTNAALDGTPLENHQFNPDIIIYNQPGEELKGYDAQLVGATKHLLNKINETEKK